MLLARAVAAGIAMAIASAIAMASRFMDFLAFEPHASWALDFVHARIGVPATIGLYRIAWVSFEG